MKKISIYDFSFEKVSYGRYKVTYTSPVTGKSWTAHIDDDDYHRCYKRE